MNILFISSGNASGSINVIIKNQGHSLEKEGLQVDYFTIQGKGIISYVKHINTLRKTKQEKHYDLYHAHYSFSAFVATFAGCKPLVVSLMGSDIQSGTFFKYFIKILSFYWRAIIVKSQAMKDFIGINRAIVLPNGVDLDKIQPMISQSTNNSRTILFAANPQRFSKNFDLAKKAILSLNNNKIILKVVHGVEHKDIINEVNKADLVLVTSRWEGSSNIIKETMACNIPVVSSDVGDVRWLFGETEGYYITSFDPFEVAEKITIALNFKEKRGRTLGRERLYNLKLDSHTIAQKLISIYKNAINNGK